MQNKYKNRKTNQVVYSDHLLDETKFEPIVVNRNTKLASGEIRVKKVGRIKKKK